MPDNESLHLHKEVAAIRATVDIVREYQEKANDKFDRFIEQQDQRMNNIEANQSYNKGRVTALSAILGFLGGILSGNINIPHN